MGAGVNEDCARRRHPDLRRLDERDAAGGGRRRRARPEAAELDPRRDADAEIAALLAQLCLLLSEFVIPDQLERAVERFVVVA